MTDLAANPLELAGYIALISAICALFSNHRLAEFATAFGALSVATAIAFPIFWVFGALP